MRERILELRRLGKTYIEISKEIGLSKSTIAYHCNENVRLKARETTRLYRASGKMKKDPRNKYGVPLFLLGKIRDFRTRAKPIVASDWFTINQFFEKFGRYTKCYLTGVEIDLYQPNSCAFDHIIPKSKGGSNNLNNLGITLPKVNTSKTDMSVSEFINMCKQVVLHNS